MYTIKLLQSAKRDIENQVAWLTHKRSASVANDWLNRLKNSIGHLEKWPDRWQKVHLNQQQYHRLVFEKHTLVFYKINAEKQQVEVYATRGAAEDWTNQPLPTD